MLELANTDHPFVWAGKDCWSLQEIIAVSALIRDELHGQKIGVGTVVSVEGSTTVMTIASLLALWSLGATTWIYSLREQAHRIRELSTSIGALDLVTKPGLPRFAVNDGARFQLHPDAKTLLNTSGSTGQPKFVQHRLSQHFESAAGVNRHMGYNENQSWLLSLPLYHVGGLAILIRSLAAGAQVVMPAKNQSIQDTLLAHDVSHVSVVATQLKRLILEPTVAAKLSQCTRVILGGGPVPSWLSESARLHQLPVVASYGATEMASTWTSTDLGGCNDLGSQGSGMPLWGRKVRIAGDGEIQVAGSMVFEKYLGKGAPEAFEEDGYYKSGDIGRVDDQGNLHIFGRIDNMFVSGGENIHPQEIELALLNHASIDEAIIVGVPNGEWGERPVAFVRFNCAKEVKEDELKEYLKTTLASFKIPDRFYNWPLDSENQLKPSRADIRKVALSRS